jgi:hypothetical protein
VVRRWILDWVVLSVGTVSVKEGKLLVCPLLGSTRASDRPLTLMSGVTMRLTRENVGPSV